MATTKVGSVFSWFLKPLTYFRGDSTTSAVITAADRVKERLSVECDQTTPKQLQSILTHTIIAYNKDTKATQTNETREFLQGILDFLEKKKDLWAEGITRSVAQTLVRELYTENKTDLVLLDSLIQCHLPLNPAKKEDPTTWIGLAQFYLNELLKKDHYDELPDYIQEIIKKYEEKAVTHDLAKHTATVSVEQLKTLLKVQDCEDYLSDIITAIINHQNQLAIDKQVILQNIQTAIEEQNLANLGTDRLEEIVQAVAPLISERFESIFSELFTREYSIVDVAVDVFAAHVNGLQHAKVEAEKARKFERLFNGGPSSSISDLEFVAFRDLPTTHESLKGTNVVSREAGELIFKMVDKFLDEGFVISLINKLKTLPDFNNTINIELINSALPLIKQLIKAYLVQKIEKDLFKTYIEPQLYKDKLESNLNKYVLPSIKQTLYLDLVQRVIYNNIDMLKNKNKTDIMNEVLRALGRDESNDDEVMSVIDAVFERYEAFKENAEVDYLKQFFEEFTGETSKDNLPLQYVKLVLDNNIQLLNEESKLKVEVEKLTLNDRDRVPIPKSNQAIRTVLDKFRDFKEREQINTEEQYYSKFIAFEPKRGQPKLANYGNVTVTLFFEYGGVNAFLKGIIKAVKWIVSFFHSFERDITISITALLHNYRKTPSYNAKIIESAVLQKFPLPKTSPLPLRDRVSIKPFEETKMEEISKILYASSKYKSSYSHRFVLWCTLGSDGKRITELFNNILANTFYKGGRFNESLLMNVLLALSDKVDSIGGKK